ncbi:Membrane protein FAM174B [Fukomys damarensis]|uniref:Membrane protein FAM174B n=1 Tax=Fukomys damarensis TaxID=885580 RepID=A0A091DU03_FUKDA|nr:Membrane protein FAM174B [Fukomys damarensis]
MVFMKTGDHMSCGSSFRSGKRLKKTRKYDIITTPAERVEMAPLNEEDDEDEDATVFDIKYRYPATVTSAQPTGASLGEPLLLPVLRPAKGKTFFSNVLESCEEWLLTVTRQILSTADARMKTLESEPHVHWDWEPSQMGASSSNPLIDAIDRCPGSPEKQSKPQDDDFNSSPRYYSTFSEWQTLGGLAREYLEKGGLMGRKYCLLEPERPTWDFAFAFEALKAHTSDALRYLSSGPASLRLRGWGAESVGNRDCTPRARASPLEMVCLDALSWSQGLYQFCSSYAPLCTPAQAKSGWVLLGSG